MDSEDLAEVVSAAKSKQPNAFCNGSGVVRAKQFGFWCDTLLRGEHAKLRTFLPLKAIASRFVEQVRSLTLLHAKVHLRDETRKEDVKSARATLLRSLTTSGFKGAGLNVKEEDIDGDVVTEILAFVRSRGDQTSKYELSARFPEVCSAGVTVVLALRRCWTILMAWTW